MEKNVTLNGVAMSAVNALRKLKTISAKRATGVKSVEGASVAGVLKKGYKYKKGGTVVKADNWASIYGAKKKKNRKTTAMPKSKKRVVKKTATRKTTAKRRPAAKRQTKKK